MYQLSSHIILIGFQGAGKTTLGKRLQEKINETTEFIDIDEVIRKTHGSHRSIIQEQAINGFRELEKKVISEYLETNPPKIIAFGGGAFLDEDTRNNIKSAQATTIFVDRSFDEMWEATHLPGRERETGPMTLSYEEAYDIYLTRLPIYKQADFVVKISKGDNEKKTLDNLLNQLSKLT